MAIAVNLGYPRIGLRRELKKAVEQYWQGKWDEQALQETCSRIRRMNWFVQQQAGIQQIPSNDFSLYDHVLDTIAMVGAVPARYAWSGEQVDLQTYFAMARGTHDAPAMEMTKWFDTNYHYIVPEFESHQRFHLASTKPVDEFLEAKALGIHTRPVLLGPVSFLLLGKTKASDVNRFSLLEGLLPVYQHVLQRLADAGADWIQIDEPCLVFDMSPEALTAFQTAYQHLGTVSERLHLCLTTYFGEIRDKVQTIFALLIQALHIDVVRVPEQLPYILAAIPEQVSLSLGVVDGRNIWRTDLQKARDLVCKAVDKLGTDRVMIAPSCSLMFSPLDVEQETTLDWEIHSWLAFARQKLAEIVLLTRSINEGVAAVHKEFAENQALIAQRRNSPKIRNPQVRERMASITEVMMHRAVPHPQRKVLQQERLQLPLLPTTTIGSFPQTTEVRQVRQACKEGRMTAVNYDAYLKQEIEKTIRFQEEIGLDVLVHGEFERSDMVEYFGAQLEGVAITEHGWVQGYGSRYIRPPIIYGDVWRPKPMTVAWATYAQSLTTKPVKGMLTGPVTLLQWSFVRDDQPRAETCRQIALAIREEVHDLEMAGIQVIQIDEPAFREGLPFRREVGKEYLEWAASCFRLASSGVREDTQIQTHMCYAEFHDIMEAIADLDADVLLIESARSHLEILSAFVDYHYPNDIGLGVYDVHSPRIPSRTEIEHLLRKALTRFSVDQLWVNPDCGLKTRRWEEIRPALMAMVEAAKVIRGEMTA